MCRTCFHDVRCVIEARQAWRTVDLQSHPSSQDAALFAAPHGLSRSWKSAEVNACAVLDSIWIILGLEMGAVYPQRISMAISRMNMMRNHWKFQGTQIWHLNTEPRAWHGHISTHLLYWDGTPLQDAVSQHPSKSVAGIHSWCCG